LHPDYRYISVGQLISDALELKSPPQFNWSNVKQAIDAGQLVDDVRHMSGVEIIIFSVVFRNVKGRCTFLC